MWHDPTAGRITFSDYFIEHWLPNRVSEPNGLATYKSHFRSSLEPTFSAVRDGLIAKSPCEGIELPRVDRREVDLYTVGEVDRLMAEIADHWRRSHYWPRTRA